MSDRVTSQRAHIACAHARTQSRARKTRQSTLKVDVVDVSRVIHSLSSSFLFYASICSPGGKERDGGKRYIRVTGKQILDADF